MSADDIIANAALLVQAIEQEDPDWRTAYEWLREALEGGDGGLHRVVNAEMAFAHRHDPSDPNDEPCCSFCCDCADEDEGDCA